MGRKTQRTTSYIRDADDDSDEANEASALLDGDTTHSQPAKPPSSSDAKYGWFDVENPHGWMRVFVLGLCFLNSAYDSFAMNLVLIILAHTAHSLSPLSVGIIATTAQLGKMCGQLVFGALAHAPGIARTRIFVATQAIVIVGALASALALERSEFIFAAWLVTARFIMGFGIGGEYPLSAVLAADTTHFAARAATASEVPAAGRGRAMSALFLMQAIGCVGAPVLVLLLVTFAPPGLAGLNLVWRLALLATAAPGAVLLYQRLILKDPALGASLGADDSFAETTASSSSSSSAAGNADTDPDAAYYESMPLSTRLSELRTYGHLVFGTAASWFLFDIVFYANAMFSATLLARTTPLPPDSPAEDVHRHIVHLARVALVIAAMAVPGYWVGAVLIDRLGRKRLQGLGFLLMGVCFAAMVALYTRYTSILEAATWLADGTVTVDADAAAAAAAAPDAAAAGGLSGYLKPGSPALVHGLFTVIYGLTFFFGNAGPNLTTFILPGETFPRHIAAVAHGISAAAGKLGAVLGALLLPLLLARVGVAPVLSACAVIAFTGAVVTSQFTVETMNTKLGTAAAAAGGSGGAVKDSASDFDDV